MKLAESLAGYNTMETARLKFHVLLQRQSFPYSGACTTSGSSAVNDFLDQETRPKEAAEGLFISAHPISDRERPRVTIQVASSLFARKYTL
jgi:hypothetical protein